MSTTLFRTDTLPGGGTAAAILLRGSQDVEHEQPAIRAGREPRRQYLKALRAAELAAWRSRGGRIEAASSPLRHAQQELRQQARQDAWLFTVVGCIAALALVLAFRDSLDITRHWAGFAAFVEQVLS